MRTPLRHIILDFDGVIVDGTNNAYIQCYYDSIRSCGIECDLENVRRAILKNWGLAARTELAGAMPEHPHQVDQALRWYSDHIDERLIVAATPIPGAVEAVMRIASRYGVSVISGMGQKPLDAIVHNLGLPPSLTRVISTTETDDPAQQKNTGYHLRRLLSELELTPDQILCVGDGSSDVMMAKSCNVEIIAVLTGTLTAARANELDVSQILPSLRELPDLLVSRSREIVLTP